MNSRVPMTPEGYETLKAELLKLKTVDRMHNVKEIEEAIAHGDLSENAEYHAAKERQSHIAGRIANIDDRLARAQVVATSGQAPDKVRFGAMVLLEDMDSGDEVSYRIVGEDEADVSKGLISITSPVARALLGKESTDEITVAVPKGTRTFEVLEIRYE
jgi:transcription elongation factor GreA